MDLFNYQNQNIKNHFQRSTRIDNDLTKDFLDHFIFHSQEKKFLIKLLLQLIIQINAHLH